MASVAEMVTQIERCFSSSPYAVMCEDEQAKGFIPVKTGSTDWLPASDWPEDVVITQKDNVVRIVALYALQPGNGAFRHLVDGIIHAGLRPVVVAPTREMQETLRRWNWRQRFIGTTFQDREEQWFPQRAFIEQRKRYEQTMPIPLTPNNARD